MIATSGFLAALECIKFVFGRGSAPEGAYSAPPAPLAGLMGPTSKWRGRDGEGKGREKGEMKGTGGTGPNFRKFLSADPPWPGLPEPLVVYT